MANREMLPPVVFWQNELSIHQESLLKEFSRLSSSPVWAVTNKGLPKRRIEQGWENVDYGSVVIRVTRSTETRKQIIAELGPEAIHIVSGLGREKTLSHTQRLLINAKARLGFYLEPWDDSTLLRRYGLPIHYRWKLRRSASIAPFFLTTAAHSYGQLAQIGIHREQVFPFGYFLKGAEYKPTIVNETQSEAERKTVNIIYVGSLSIGKQALLLAQVVVDMPSPNLKLTIIGDGIDGLEVAAIAKGYPDRITYLGSVSNDEARSRMREADFLILPSKYDGWGAVLTEALAEGTPVLASSACGASQVINSQQQGFVFDPGEIGIRLALVFALKAGPTTDAKRVSLVNWATKTLTGNAGAHYLSDILKYRFGEGYVRPDAPWTSMKIIHRGNK